MGRRGPAREPTKLKVLKGNPGKRPLNDSEPTPAPGAPCVPAGLELDEVAQQQWDSLSRVLSDMRVLTEADGLILAALCQTYSRWVEASTQLAQSGLIYRTSKSRYVQQNPLLGIVNTCLSQITQFCRELGLTPSARSSIQTTEPKSKTENKFKKLG